MTDRRTAPRVEVELEIHYRTQQEFAGAFSRNISGGGIFIRTPKPLPLNHEVRLRFTLPGIAHRFEVRGLVVWTNPTISGSSFPPGMGIKFLDLDSAAERLIAGFVAMKASGPAPEPKPGGA